MFFGRKQAEHDPDGYYKFSYHNQIGHSVIQITVNDQPLPPLEVEVISPKLSLKKGDPLYYPDFYRALVDQLVEHSAALPFTFTAPTYHTVEASTEPPSPLFHLSLPEEQSSAAPGGIGDYPGQPASAAERGGRLSKVAKAREQSGNASVVSRSHPC